MPPILSQSARLLKRRLSPIFKNGPARLLHGLVFLSAGAVSLLLAGCNRENNPLLSLPAPGVNSVQMSLPQIDTSSGDNMRIFVYVADGSGNPLGQFQLGNFSILEGGNPGIPFEVGPVTEPLYLALCIDRSGSMGGQKETDAESAAVDLVNSLGPNDYTALVDFTETVTITLGFTNDKAALIAAIIAGNSGGATAFYDAVNVSAGLVQSPIGRRLVIGLTDGQDNSSSITDGGLISSINSKGLSVYLVGLGLDVETAILQNIAASTGGTYTSSDGSDLSAIFQGILARFNNLNYIKYRRRNKGNITAYLNYGPLTASASKSFD